jgi:hypothetical protein
MHGVNNIEKVTRKLILTLVAKLDVKCEHLWKKEEKLSHSGAGMII